MKTNVIIKKIALTIILFVSSFSVFANSNDGNLIYNSEVVNGIKIGETVYKTDGSSLINYMKYNYKYDANNRMIENESLKWDGLENAWTKNLCIKYIYEGKTITTNYYKWNKENKKYVLVPEMTVKMDNSNM